MKEKNLIQIKLFPSHNHVHNVHMLSIAALLSTSLSLSLGSLDLHCFAPGLSMSIEIVYYHLGLLHILQKIDKI